MTVVVTKMHEVAVLTGVLNKHSIAYGIAQALIDQGVTIIYLVQPGFEKRAQRDLGEDAIILPCNVEGKLIVENTGDEYVAKYEETDADIMAAVAYVQEKYGEVQYLFHAIAHSDKAELEGDIRNLSRNNFHHTMEVSALSFVRLATCFEPVLADNASVVTMTFRGSSAVAANYFAMGMAKAALECSMRYLASYFGPRGIRVNAVAPGPVKTMAFSGIKDSEVSFFMGEVRSATGRNVTAAELGRTTVKLAQSEGITGAILPVDNGIWDMVGMGTTTDEMEVMRAERLRRLDAAKAAKRLTAAD